MQTIVVPTDCSALSREALRYADRFAARTGATVIAVYGSAFSARLEGEGIAASFTTHDDVETMMAPIRACMADTVNAAVSAETRHEIIIDDCPPADAIVSVSNRRNADLIIMGTHDRNRLTRAVLGSVTDDVLHQSKRPVLILREHNNVAQRPVQRILCAYRPTPVSDAARREAEKLASALGAELTIFEVPDEKNVADRVLAGAQEHDADLIVMGTKHRRFSDPSEAGRPASEIVRRAYCPVLSVCG